MGFFDFMTEDIAIDLGTANTLIIHNDKVVIDSPSIVARDRISGKIIAVGKEANMMQGKTEQHRKQQYLQDIAAGKGTDHAARNNIQQKGDNAL